MAGHFGRWWFPVAFAVLLLLAAGPSRGEEARLAISGYDPVAYFTDSKPVPGQSEFEYPWHNARWRFASVAHRDAFAGNPDRYAPQYGGYCAGGVTGADFAGPHKDTVDPEVWTIVDGKLYLAHFGGPLWDEWREKAAENIKRADDNWKFVKDQAEPVIVGPPCRGRPPAVIFTTSDGKRELVIGSQVALDNDGNIVGKGDMRAQIEQVGKNVEACLKAAGASKSNIVWAQTYVANKETFLKYADVWANYLGPQRPASTIVEKPQLAGPDFLVETKAFALLN
jgi:enamine deaminase RidA (YjgF/YER057c/UK114 family)